MLADFRRNKERYYEDLYRGLKRFAKLLELEEKGHEFTDREAREYHLLHSYLCVSFEANERGVIEGLTDNVIENIIGVALVAGGEGRKEAIGRLRKMRATLEKG